MSIQYPVDVVNTRWAVLQLSTGEIVGRNKAWPVADGSAIPGLDPDFVYLKHVNSTPPDYDSRVYTLNGIETVSASANTITLTYATAKRPLPELLVAAENVESEQTQRLIKFEREVIETRLMVSALIQFMDGLQLPPKMRTFADDYKAKGVKLWQNRDRLNEIRAAYQAGTEPNLDAGWQNP